MATTSPRCPGDAPVTLGNLTSHTRVAHPPHLLVRVVPRLEVGVVQNVIHLTAACKKGGMWKHEGLGRVPHAHKPT